EQRRTRADLLMKGRRFDLAATEYRGILDSIRSDMSQQSLQHELQVKLGGALYRQHQLEEAKSLLESVPASSELYEAERFYYLHEIARSKDDGDRERQILSDMMQKFPASPWLQEALLSASNMYLLRPDYKNAIEFYTAQFKLFPEGKYSPYSHWKAAWLNLRTGNKDDVDKNSFEAPSDDLRVARAQLLTNAALFDFAVRELQAEPDKLYAKAEIARVYLKADRPDRALQSFKRAVPGYFAGDITDMPSWAWNILFPKPYWNELTRYANANGLDPYLVASLIRQQSEFNPQAVSHANAWGLMQLLPPVGKKLAKEVR